MLQTAHEEWALAYEAGLRAWPGVTLDRDEFMMFAREAGLLPSAADGGADALLAYACARGSRRALLLFEQLLIPVARKAVARIDNTRAFVDDALQAFRQKLLVGPPPAIARFSGRAPLRVWLRVAATRVALDALRRNPRRCESVDALQEELESSLLDPVQSHLATVHRPHFQAALQRAFEKLTVRDRNLLRLHLLDGLSIDALAGPLGVHRATVARTLSAIRARLSEAVFSELRLQIPAASRSELESLWRAIRSQVALSVSSLLCTQAVCAEEPSQLGDLP